MSRTLDQIERDAADVTDVAAVLERLGERVRHCVEDAREEMAGQQELPMPPAQQVNVDQLRMLVAHLGNIVEPRIVNMGEAQHMRDRVRANVNALLTLLSPTEDTEG